MMFLLLFICIALASVLLTWGLRRYALSHSLIDIPNERSSHEIPTPRGGGVSIVLTFLAGLIILEFAGFLPVFLFWALFGSGAVAALIGWGDDRLDLPARLRLPGHFIGAIWALVWLGGLPVLPWFGVEINLGIAGHILAAIYLVWLLNLYNFMDGINGIAGIEAITVCAGGIVLFVISGEQAEGMWMLPALLAAAAVGFLFWNFPKARIFMGDAASGFLGLVLGVMSINAGWAAPELFWGWVILLGAFIVDSTVTLLRRALRGEKVYEAHCCHAYQNAAQKYGSHTPVTLVYGAINLFWLLPAASFVVAGLLKGALGVVVAYAPLVVGAVWFGAGKPADPEIIKGGQND
ncbi:MAG: glycosyltransferase family 4 protein [Thermodesulfobacteriota bacterium]|nr:glycosyltransferase family 4 protein [Thermodesulfobacteriota bacterium]